MSKKTAQFRIKPRETILKRGMMDYCVTGRYSHAAAGNAILTDERFLFVADLPSGERLAVECPLEHIYSVEKTGVPFFTRSMIVVTDEGRYRLNAFLVGRWIKALRRAVRDRTAPPSSQ